MKLKDGSISLDRRLDRIVQFDKRSRQFPVRQLLEAKKPRSYTWRLDLRLDQGTDGACVGFGIAHELAALPAPVPGLDFRFAKERIYWEAQKIDPWPGGAYPGASPRYEGTSVLAGIKVAHKMGYFDSYRWSFGIEDLILGVGYNGPAVVGTVWTRDMFRPGQHGFIHPTGAIVGGHCYLINSVDVKGKCFTIVNSWGPSWGRNGCAFITWHEMDRLLQQAGEAAFMIGRKSNPS